MTLARRRLLVGGLAAGGVAAVVAGVLLARGGQTAAPVALVDPPASTAAQGVDGKEPAGSAAPELSGTDPITGEPVSLADFEGKPVVVNLWASWCTGCNVEAPDLRRFAAAHPEAVLLGIDIQDAASDARAFYRRYSWEHPSIADPSGELAARLGYQGLPTTYFLSPDHRLVAAVVGAADFATFEQGLALAAQAGA